MKPKKNPVVVAMVRRYGKSTKVHKDRRTGRGGSRNKQNEYLRDVE